MLAEIGLFLFGMVVGAIAFASVSGHSKVRILRKNYMHNNELCDWNEFVDTNDPYTFEVYHRGKCAGIVEVAVDMEIDTKDLIEQKTNHSLNNFYHLIE